MHALFDRTSDRSYGQRAHALSLTSKDSSLSPTPSSHSHHLQCHTTQRHQNLSTLSNTQTRRHVSPRSTVIYPKKLDTEATGLPLATRLLEFAALVLVVDTNCTHIQPESARGSHGACRNFRPEHTWARHPETKHRKTQTKRETERWYREKYIESKIKKKKVP
jgi:hypothetical protein